MPIFCDTIISILFLEESELFFDLGKLLGKHCYLELSLRDCIRMLCLESMYALANFNLYKVNLQDSSDIKWQVPPLQPCVPSPNLLLVQRVQPRTQPPHSEVVL